MIDTDGCIFRKIRRDGKGFEYRSVGIKFTSASSPLRNSLIYFFSKVGFKVALSGRDIYLSGKELVYKYVQEIGFSNPKHLNRYKSFLKTHAWKKVKIV